MIEMDCDKGFSSGYLILKPEELRPLDLIRMLFSDDIEKPRFVDSSDPTERSFRRRWLIFVSVVILKLLHFFFQPLALFGSAFEFFLNFLSHNSISQFFLRGEVVLPKETWASYVSFLGNFDKRINLDAKTSPKDGHRYYTALSTMASKLAYENYAHINYVVEHHWKMESLGGLTDYWNEYQEKATTQAFMLSDKSIDVQETIVVAFRGTEPFDSEAWCSNFDMTWYEVPEIGRIHGGFMKALGLQKNYGWPKHPNPNPDRTAPIAYYAIRDALKTLTCQNQRTRFVLTGHSQGGALAILFVTVLIIHDEHTLLDRVDGVYTYGQPRVGDSRFGEFMEKKLQEHDIKYFRFVYNNDIVPRLPYDDNDLMFKHFGTCIYYNGRYKAKVLNEEPDKSYFTVVGSLRMKCSAALELLRSFTIASAEGPEFKEGWVLRVARVLGLIFPGISNHLLQDYVNATRLDHPDVFKIRTRR